MKFDLLTLSLLLTAISTKGWMQIIGISQNKEIVQNRLILKTCVLRSSAKKTIIGCYDSEIGKTIIG
jgi:hypothetical protein